MANVKENADSVQVLNPKAAGIDIGSRSHFVSVPPTTSDRPIREFSTFTDDLYKIAAWLKESGVETVAMESTGVYWIPLYDILEAEGFEVYLVNAQHLKNAPGRKTDVQDCQWIRQLHSFGLLQKSFRPQDVVLQMRDYMRQRTRLIQDASSYVLRMQKALTQMNIQIHNVIRDLTGVTGMKILRAIIKGEKDPTVLAKYRHYKCKESVEEFERSLHGTYKEEHIFALKQALELFDTYSRMIKECEKKVEEKLLQMEDADTSPEASGAALPGEEKNASQPIRRKKSSRKLKKHEFSFNVSSHLERVTGVNLMAIPGIGETAALMMLSEIGVDITHWRNAKHFTSWLGLCPKNKISGGRVLHSRTRPGAQRVSWVLRMCAQTLYKSQTALGAHLRRLKSRLGSPKAITAIAHKLARMLYNMLRYGSEYVEASQEEYEKKHEEKALKNLQIQAKRLGMILQPADNAQIASS